MLKVSGLEKSYGRQDIFDNVSFVINPGERVGLVGKNGHGKTTLFRMILGQEQPDAGVITYPSYYTLGHLSQHIHFTGDTVLKEGCLGLKPNEYGIDESYKVKAILTGLGFSDDDFDRNPGEFSGGYQVRINLAKVLASEPNLLLLDEPTNYLDIVSVRWLIRFLREWPNELMIITHDRDFMDNVTTHTIGIHRSKIKKIAGNTYKLYEQIATEEEVYEKTRVNDDKKRKEIEEFVNRFRAKATKARAVQSRIKALDRMGKLEKLSDIRTLDFEFNNLSVGKNDRIAIIGKNGKGKTTLLNILSGELQPRRGSVSHHPNIKIAYFGQTNINRLVPAKTVEQEIMEVHPDHNRGVARRIAGIMMFSGDAALKKISVLSGGEKSRVLLGKLLVTPANILLLDEPTNHLDMDSIDSLTEAVDAFEGAAIIVTHSELILHTIATRLIVFDGGEVNLFEGTYQEFLDSVGWKDEENTEAAIGKKKGMPGKKVVGEKEAKKARADLASSRTKVLGNLQKKILEIETAIIQLEKYMENDSQAIQEASEKGDGEALSTLSISIHESTKKLNALFNELEVLTIEHDTKAKEFDEKAGGHQ
ncbi:MAG: ABC-F family ATP-binding cassette domain-containing protein [Deltaproteobacteria bacterium]|nr:ABC-F family ATP-binding cassette domain-containing protein [Deltaproteobacteria bacterium]